MKLELENYIVEIQNETLSIFLGNRRYAVLKVQTAAHGIDEKDIDGPLSSPEISRREGGIDVVWQAKSSRWDRKSYHWRFEKDLFWCQIEIEGRNTLGELRYFDNGTHPSHYDFSRFFTTECLLLDQSIFRSMQFTSPETPFGPDINHLLLPPHEGTLVNPPPFFYGLGFSKGPWLCCGIAPEKGQYNFSEFRYVSGYNSFWFRLAYDGKTQVDGTWKAPKFVFKPADTPYDGLNQYCDLLRQWNLVEPNHHPQAKWWSRPMFCGWGEQHICSIRGGNHHSNSYYATQAVYDSFLEIIQKQRLNPGTITIDDKWQKHYGTMEVDTDKWPDLRGWIDARHAENRKVILWYGVCNPEGLPKDECIVDSEGNPVFPDPSNPVYLQRVKEIVYRMISSDPGCYNADGIKLDWFYTPGDSKYRLHGKIWGVELFKQLVQQIYDTAKAAKPDALIITHAGNPYFAECSDMQRLCDITDRSREISEMMAHRSRIHRAACPHALIDCDNSCAPTHIEWMEYMKLQPNLGVPSCYFLTAVDGTMEPITDEDWDELASIWRS